MEMKIDLSQLCYDDRHHNKLILLSDFNYDDINSLIQHDDGIWQKSTATCIICTNKKCQRGE